MKRTIIVTEVIKKIEPVHVRRKFVVLAFYSVLAVLITYPGIKYIRTGHIGLYGDPNVFMWFMKWVAYAITHLKNPLSSNYIMYPNGVNLMHNPSIFLVSVVMTPITNFFGVLVSYNIVVLLGMALSAFTAFLASRKFLKHDLASVLAGGLYGFSPYMVAHSMGHMHMTQVYIVPLFLWLGYDIFVSQNIGLKKSGILLGMLLAGQILIAEEVFASAVIMGIIAVAVLLLIFLKEKSIIKEKSKYVLKVLMFATLVFSILAAPFLMFQFLGPWQPSPGRLQSPNTYVTDALNLFCPGPFQWLRNSGTDAVASRFTGNYVELNAYLGLPFISIFIFSFLRWFKDKSILFLSTMTMIAGVLSLGPFLHVAGFDTHLSMPWRLFGSLPLLEHLLPCRIGLYMYLFVAVIISSFAERMCNNGRLSRTVALGAVGLGLVFYAPRIPYPVQHPDLPTFFSNEVMVNQIPENSVAFVVPVSYEGHGTAMLWQAISEMRFKMPEGYAISIGSGPNRFNPAECVLIDRVKELQSGKQVILSETDAATIYEFMRLLDIRTVIVGPVSNQDNIVEFFNQLLDIKPNFQDGVYYWKIRKLYATEPVPMKIGMDTDKH